MSSPAELDPRRLPETSGYSAAVRSALGFTALVVTLLPIPVTYFGILPTYQVHGWFLLVYAPFLCLLTLSYLFYVRDSLARAMFRDVLDPPPPPDPYSREPLAEQLKRGFRHLKGALLGILPLLLIATSMYCVSRYLSSLDQSVALAAQAYVERSAASEEPGKKKSSVPRRGGAADDSRLKPAVDSLPRPGDSTAVRQYVLRTSRIDEIPGVVELSALYLGAFVALLIAVTLMALKEYAKEALGLSEHELMFGRYYRREESE
jgi:hypothetical protein